METIDVKPPADGFILVSLTGACGSQASNGHLNWSIADAPMVWTEEATATATLNGGYKALAVQAVFPVEEGVVSTFYSNALINEVVPSIVCWGQMVAQFSPALLE